MANLFRERGSAENWSAILGAAAKTMGINPTLPSPPDLHNPSLNSDVFAKTLDIVIFPRKSAASGMNDKGSAWQ